jgi:hypothetical protein
MVGDETVLKKFLGRNEEHAGMFSFPPSALRIWVGLLMEMACIKVNQQ